jgi:formylmethanofuran dehydrogenase subunit E
VKKTSVDLKIIGIVHSPYKTAKDVPRLCTKEISEIEIYKEFEQGLKDIEGFTHIHVLYWLHKSSRYSLHVKTPWDDSLHGLFTTRSPYRPNPIGHTTAELVKRKDNILKVKGLDAIDNTPVIDIKPYVKKFDIKTRSVSGWLEKTEL